VVGGSVGTAIALPAARALKQAGNHVIGITGSRTKDLLILEDELRAASDEIYVMTDDGSYGEQGLVTKKLQELIDSGRPINYVLAIGPVPMMRAVAQVHRAKGIKTVVSLNSIMVDGTGMCGGMPRADRLRSEFACVDGPEFDAQKVNFEVLMQRITCTAKTNKNRSTNSWPIANGNRAGSPILQNCANWKKKRARRWPVPKRVPARDRMKIVRTIMPEQDAASAGHNFLEVNLGLPVECAQQESMRCIECKDPKCVTTCPVGVKVREFLDLVLEGNYLAAAAKNSRRQCPARHHRTRLPAGRPMRRRMPARNKGRAARHRLP